MHQFIAFSVEHWELWLAFFVILILLVGLELRNKIFGLATVSPHHAIMLINREDAVVLDVRDNGDFSNGHILDAINIPLSGLDAQLSQIEKHKAKPIILVFNANQSPAKVSALLLNNGFNHLRALRGGMSAWQSAGLPTVK